MTNSYERAVGCEKCTKERLKRKLVAPAERPERKTNN